MKILVTGADGFVGKNLVLRLRELPDTDVLTFVRGDSNDRLNAAVSAADADARPRDRYPGLRPDATGTCHTA